MLVGRVLAARRNRPAKAARLNDRTADFLGRSFVLHEPIEEGTGRIRAGDNLWRVTGPDLPAGTAVRAVAVEPGRLVVAGGAAGEASAAAEHRGRLQTG